MLGAAMLVAAPTRAQAPLAEQQIARAINRMFGSPEEALGAARVAEREADKDPASGLLATKARWLEGEALSRLDRDAEAEPVVSRALDDARKRWPKTVLHADLLMTWGGNPTKSQPCCRSPRIISAGAQSVPQPPPAAQAGHSTGDDS